MKATGYYIFFGINYLITLLPLRVLYLFSDLFYLVLYYLAGYRRKVVAANLRNAFPEKSEAERKKIERRFYRHLCDLIRRDTEGHAYEARTDFTKVHCQGSVRR